MDQELTQYKEYFIYLEDLRKSGVTNMFGASSYLEREFGIDHQLAIKILSLWMKNYKSLSEEFGWRE